MSNNQCGFNPFPKQKACIYYLTQDNKVKECTIKDIVLRNTWRHI